MDAKYKDCQSCGMPLGKDPLGGGSESDGSVSRKFCSHCYQGGTFTQPNLTVEEMVSQVRNKMTEMKIPGFMHGLFTRKIPKLERWR